MSVSTIARIRAARDNARDSQERLALDAELSEAENALDKRIAAVEAQVKERARPWISLSWEGKVIESILNWADAEKLFVTGFSTAFVVFVSAFSYWLAFAPSKMDVAGHCTTAKQQIVITLPDGPPVIYPPGTCVRVGAVPVKPEPEKSK